MRTIANRERRFRYFRRRAQRAFTLVELLVVIALTALLLTLVFKPLLDSFNLTSRAGTLIESQQNARNVLSEVTNTLGSAVFVYDNLQTPINLWLTTRDGTPYAAPTRFAMVEYVKPARTLDQQPGTGPIDPTSGEPIYPDSVPAGQRGYAFPLAPGRALGRYFIGLVDNSLVANTGQLVRAYANKFETPRLSGVDNRYTLYKAEVQVYILEPGSNTNRYVPNLGLFHTRDANGQRTMNVNDALDLHDPNFFYDNTPAGPAGGNSRQWAAPGWRDLNGDGIVQISENWRALATSIMPVGKVDMVVLDRDEVNGEVAYYRVDSNGAFITGTDGNPEFDTANRPESRPQPRLMVRFEPSFIENDPGVPGQVGNAGNEAPDAASPAYAAKHTHWATPYRVMVFRNPATDRTQTNPNPNADPLTLDPTNFYMATGGDATLPGKIGRVTMARYATVPNFATLQDVGPNPDPATGMWRTANGTLRNPNLEFAFTVDPKRGLVNFAFPSAVLVGYDANRQPIPSRFEPVQINAGMLTIGKRFLDLRTLSTVNYEFANETSNRILPLNEPSAISPLNLFGANQPLNVISRVSIVPGSDIVYGPDQRPGPNYGRRVQYTRVSASATVVGKNEYKINYADVSNAVGLDRTLADASNDPRLRVGYIEFNSISESSDGAPNIPPPVLPNQPGLPQEDPAGILTATRQPFYRPHGMPQLKAVNGDNVPADPVEVYYEFQLNRTTDVVKYDYMTRELMNITLESRLYDPRSSRPQLTSISGRVKVRNLQR